jgi:hypothetical protein
VAAENCGKEGPEEFNVEPMAFCEAHGGGGMDAFGVLCAVDVERLVWAGVPLTGSGRLSAVESAALECGGSMSDNECLRQYRRQKIGCWRLWAQLWKGTSGS